MSKILDLTPDWGDRPHLQVLDISDDAAAVSAERARFGNRSVRDYPAPGWYDLDELRAAGLYCTRPEEPGA